MRLNFDPLSDNEAPPTPTLTVVTSQQGFAVWFGWLVAARAPPLISCPASLPHRLVLPSGGQSAYDRMLNQGRSNVTG